jgi:hypothetical protein
LFGHLLHLRGTSAARPADHFHSNRHANFHTECDAQRIAGSDRYANTGTQRDTDHTRADHWIAYAERHTDHACTDDHVHASGTNYHRYAGAYLNVDNDASFSYADGHGYIRPAHRYADIYSNRSADDHRDVSDYALRRKQKARSFQTR